MRQRIACFMALLAVTAACGVEATDRTSDPLVYSAPLNVQTFNVEVSNATDLTKVELVVVGVGTIDMEPPTSDNPYWHASLPLALCAESMLFSVEIEASGGPYTRPETGGFAHRITGLPQECEAFTQAFSQTHSINSQLDFVDSQPGDGICEGANPTGGTACSLRAAIMESNARPGLDLIEVPGGRYTLTLESSSESSEGLTDASNDLDITDDLVLRGTTGTSRDAWDVLTEMPSQFGNGDDLKDNPDTDLLFAKIDANANDRVFQVAAGATAQLQNVAVMNGRLTSGRGAGILNDGNLALSRVLLVENQGLGDFSSLTPGGGIANSGTLLVEDSVVARNNAQGFSGGGALANTGTAIVRRSLLAYNSSGFGGATINRSPGTLTLENVTIFGTRERTSVVRSVVHNIGSGDGTTLRFVTLAANEANGEIRNEGPSPLVMVSTLIMWNVQARNYCNGDSLSGGGIVTDAPCARPSSGAVALDHIDVNLGSRTPLSDEGGFSPVVAISPQTGAFFNLIDEGAGITFYPEWDARSDGFDRVVNGGTSRAPDPGAFEYQG